MKSIILYLSFLLTVFIFASCEKDIEFNGEITAPLVVVNSYITPDSVVSAHVSESRFFLKDSVSFKNISNAEVSVWVNGVFKETMKHIEKGTYLGTYVPLVGETIKFIVKVPSKKDVNCEAKMLAQPAIISIDTTVISKSKEYIITNSGSSVNNGPTVWTNDTLGFKTGFRINYTLKFKDNAIEKNYYRLVVITKDYYKRLDPYTNDSILVSSNNYNFNFTDVVSGNNANNNPLDFITESGYNEYNVFSDDFFNGKEYPLKFSIDNDTYEYFSDNYYEEPSKKEVYIYLQSISKDLYLYLKSRTPASYGTDFFSEAIQVHNNIVGGIGILGSYTSGIEFKYILK